MPPTASICPKSSLGTEPGPYPPGPPSSTQPGSSLPSPIATAPRPFLETKKHLSPQLLHPALSFRPRQHALPGFSDFPRSPFTSRSTPPVSDRRQSPSPKPEISPQYHQHEQQKPPKPHHPLNRMHAVPPHAPGPYHPREIPHATEADDATQARYDAAVSRHFESWSYQGSLSRISSLSYTIPNYAKAYS
ncbi:hypothetical protein FOMG_02405 [Fusarium oxysporum f. sp. melonis 26406]|uniref:Uncharacterized protein n=1 Tax=Fusarium oxysporum f. sp. melonis 26406 TaxID=1089452 RepID=X0AIE3_FUSOX|nr:hypothetical protein FOMG_02405 [Fusarium oxysporum f. sp. melonis 26406]